MIFRRGFAWALVLAALFATLSSGAAVAAVGHGSTSANLAKLAAGVSQKPAAPRGGENIASSVGGQAAGWSGGILALEGFRRLAAPLTSALGSGLASFLPPGIARVAAGLVTEVASGAAFKMGMDAGQDLLTTGSVKKPDWLEVTGAAVGMVAGGLLGKPLGPIGEAIGSWLGWSLGENLAKQLRAGKGVSLTAAFKDIDVPRLALQAVTAEGAALVAGPLVTGVLGLTGTAGAIARIAVQIGLSAGASVIARKVGDELLGPEDDDKGEAAAPPNDLPALERGAQDAYRRFVEASRNPATPQPTLSKTLADYRAARTRLDSARSGAR